MEDNSSLIKGSYISTKNKLIFICIPTFMFNIEDNFQNTFFSYVCPKLKLECRNLKNEKILSVDSYFTFLDLESSLEFKDYFTFTIIRNPWEGLVTMYLNLQNSQNQSYISNSAKFFNFKDWVIYITEILILSNSHFTCSKHSKKRIDFLIRYESFNQDFKKFCEINKMPYKEFKIYTTEDYKKYYDKHLIKYLNLFLKIDEENYGYKL